MDTTPVAVPAPFRLSPDGSDQHGENERLRALGALVRVELPDRVEAWATTRQDVLEQILSDPRIAKDARHWTALASGEVPKTWPLINFVMVQGMVTADGEEHRRLRSLVTQAFTPRRVEALRPHIEAVVTGLLDDLDDLVGTVDGPVDLVDKFTHCLPMNVISELLGIPDGERDRFRRLSQSLTSSSTASDDVLTTQRDLYGLLDDVVALRRSEPGNDLTSGLIAAREDDGSRLTEAELVGTMLLMLIAGHVTTQSLLTNAVRALLTHPGQLALVRDGSASWGDVIEETLRWNSPVGQFPMRYALEDIEIAGTVIRRGEAILASYAAVGRDPERHGEDAGRFDLTRTATRHVAFGHGVHYCLGAGLARLEAGVALPALFARFPRLALAVPDSELRAVSSVVTNSIFRLPVTLA